MAKRTRGSPDYSCSLYAHMFDVFGEKVLIPIPSHLGFPIHTKLKMTMHVLFHHIFILFPMLYLVVAAILDFRPTQKFKLYKGHSF